MRTLLPYSYYGADTDEQQQFYSELRPVAIISQSVGLLSWITAAVILASSGQTLQASLLFGVPGMLLSLGISLCARSVKALVVSGIVGTTATAFAFRLLVAYCPDPTFWVLPVGTVLTLSAAPIFGGMLNYIGAAIAVWLILTVGNFPAQPGQLTFNLSLLVMGSSFAMAIYLHAYFLNLRVRSHRARRELAEMAFKDLVTGLNNRRKFTLEVRRAQARPSPSALHFLMIDIDDFKKINDTLGHDVGDEVLIHTAKEIARLAAGHVCGRLGGEEFGVLFHGEAAEAQEFAVALLDSVRKATHPPRTVSIGIAEFDRDSDLSITYKRADEALYLAKRHGKNRHVLAGAIQAAA
ncbi:diguanylate cyclase [Rugamonas sp. FT82W]|uniref:diguanylate cyclase n=1 Tax=Duganella vulcania TaxID=2692166 RepID=A0A845G223_9BURK|nr:GGDEF domain-containing protein [Duganella vulcania]MYM86959.1 diguanylate cyclase [Duganella vulcania]